MWEAHTDLQERGAAPAPHKAGANRWAIILIPYFGRWPEWINFFVESCKPNPEIQWRLYTDCGEADNKAGNVEYVHMGFADYKALVRQRLGLQFDPSDPYKLCDLKPCLGDIHQRELRDYRFYGYGDIDVIYGNIGKFYDEEIRARYNVISSHPETPSGHFVLFRNASRFRRAYRRIPGYKDLLARPDVVSLDELHFRKVFLVSNVSNSWMRFFASFDRRRRRLLFVERYSTVLSPRGWHDGTMNYPTKWFWRQGRLTNDRDGDREFLYLHFMRWRSTRYINSPPAGGEGAWLDLERIVHIDWRSAAAEGFCISQDGFTPR